jgi:hypothetical protein
MQIQDFLREYETKSNEELLRLATDPSQLTDEANSALLAEMRKRGLDDSEQLNNFRQQEKERKQEEENSIGRLWISARTGIGRQRFCKANYQADPASGIEEFTTTVFILIFWLPLIPTGTFRVSRNKKSLFNQVRGIEKLPLNWAQVMQVWFAMMLGILFLILILKFLAYMHIA